MKKLSIISLLSLMSIGFQSIADENKGLSESAKVKVAQPITQSPAKSAIEQKTVLDNSSQMKSELIAKLATFSQLSAQFTQQVFDQEGNMLQEGLGEFSLLKPNLVRWQTNEPDESLIVSDGNTLWFFDPFIEQATAYTLSNAIANTPILLLTNQEQTMWDNYDVKKQSDDHYLIHALASNSQVKTLELMFTDSVLSGFTIIDATGQLSKITLTEQITNGNQVPEDYSFTVPEGVHLDDQR